MSIAESGVKRRNSREASSEDYLGPFLNYLRASGLSDGRISHLRLEARHFLLWLQRHRMPIGEVDYGVLRRFRRHDCRCPGMEAHSVSRNPSTTVSLTRQRVALIVGLDGGHERGLARRAASALAAASLAAEIGIVELDRPAERVLSVALHHHLHQLVAYAPGGVVGDAELAVQRHRRAPTLALGHEVDALEPHREGQLRGLEDGAGGNGCLAVAAVALLELAGVQLAAVVMATVRAEEA